MKKLQQMPAKSITKRFSDQHIPNFISGFVFIPSGDPISSCTNVQDGRYQSSTNCNTFIQCSSESLSTHTCPVGQFFDDDSDACGSSTSTCQDACTPGPCQNGATCAYEGSDYVCQCAEGYEGTDCGKEVMFFGDILCRFFLGNVTLEIIKNVNKKY